MQQQQQTPTLRSDVIADDDEGKFIEVCACVPMVLFIV